MKRMPRTWMGAAVGTFALMSLAGCIAGGGYGGDVGVGYVGYVGGVYEPGGYEYGGWGRGYPSGLRAAACAGRAGGRRPRFRGGRAAEAAIAAGRGHDRASHLLGAPITGGSLRFRWRQWVRCRPGTCGLVSCASS